MDISQYFIEDVGSVSFDEIQASKFAKSVAGDFNPIHDPGSKRFCVPGDLLFSVLLHRYGVAQTTDVVFSGMLDAQTKMILPESVNGRVPIVDARNRELLSILLDGKHYNNAPMIAQLRDQYVRFSGKTFPDILVPLMKTAGVMINPARPLVVYKDMSLQFNDAAEVCFSDGAAGDEHHVIGRPIPSHKQLTLRLADTNINVDGRKGLVQLKFSIHVGKLQIGTGEKNMLLSGLRAFEEPAMQTVVEQYNQWRNRYQEIEHARR